MQHAGRETDELMRAHFIPYVHGWVRSVGGKLIFDPKRSNEETER